MEVFFDHYYLFGDVYATLDTCDELERLLGRLDGQQLLDDQDCTLSRQNIGAIRSSLEAELSAPRGALPSH